LCKRFSTELSFKNTVSVVCGGKDTAGGILTHWSFTLSAALPVTIAKMPIIFENICFTVRLFTTVCRHR
jgi:hypothetical protein